MTRHEIQMAEFKTVVVSAILLISVIALFGSLLLNLYLLEDLKDARCDINSLTKRLK